MMKQNQVQFEKPKQGGPVYLLFRYGKLIVTGGNVPRIFYSKEHFESHKKRYNGTFLSTDELVKYVPERRGEWIYHECVSSYDGLKSGYSCSNCSAFVDEDIFDMDEYHKQFCPSCGADMRKEDTKEAVNDVSGI